MIDYELKHICDNALKDSITSHFSRDNLLVKLAGAFGPSNAGEAQARMSHTTGGADTPPTGGFRNWGGQMSRSYGGLQAGADMNGVENRTNRMQSAGMHQQQMQMPEPRDNDDDNDGGGDSGGGFFGSMMGSMFGTGFALVGKGMYDKYAPMIQQGNQIRSSFKTITENQKEFGEELKHPGLWGSIASWWRGVGDVPQRTIDDKQFEERFKQLPEEARNEVTKAMQDMEAATTAIKQAGKGNYGGAYRDQYGRIMNNIKILQKYNVY